MLARPIDQMNRATPCPPAQARVAWADSKPCTFLFGRRRAGDRIQACSRTGLTMGRLRTSRVSILLSVLALVAAATAGCRKGDSTAGGQHPPAATQQSAQGWDLYRTKYRDPALELASGMVKEPRLIRLTDDGDVVLRDAGGNEVWRKHVGGKLGSVRPPDAILHGGRVVVVRYPGLVALDAATGDEVWTCDEPSDRLAGHGDLLLAMSCDYEAADKRWLVARKVRDGSVAWRVAVPWCEDPPVIETIGDFLVVSSDERRSGYRTLMIDMQGHTVLDVPEFVYSGRPAQDNGDLLLLTNKRVVRFRPAERRVIWQVEQPPRHGSPFNYARLVGLASGDLVVYYFGPISNSGVKLQRIEPLRGTVRWAAVCEPLGGVMHSEYYHCVYVKELGQELLVVSQGRRYFVELLDLATGLQRQRFEFEPPRE